MNDCSSINWSKVWTFRTQKLSWIVEGKSTWVKTKTNHSPEFALFDWIRQWTWPSNRSSKYLQKMRKKKTFGICTIEKTGHVWSVNRTENLNARQNNVFFSRRQKTNDNVNCLKIWEWTRCYCCWNLGEKKLFDKIRWVCWFFHNVRYCCCSTRNEERRRRRRRERKRKYWRMVRKWWLCSFLSNQQQTHI